MGNVATLYFYGLGVPQSYSEAAQLRQVAARESNADAQNKLGAMYNDGRGLAQDPHRAGELFRQAAEQGYAPAMVNLGRMYTEAIGVKRDDIYGYALIRTAINIGVPAGMNELALYELGAAGARLPPKQLALAQQIASQLSVSRSARTALSPSATDGATTVAWRW